MTPGAGDSHHQMARIGLVNFVGPARDTCDAANNPTMLLAVFLRQKHHRSGLFYAKIRAHPAERDDPMGAIFPIPAFDNSLRFPRAGTPEQLNRQYL